jgi:hypothetical protein
MRTRMLLTLVGATALALSTIFTGSATAATPALVAVVAQQSRLGVAPANAATVKPSSISCNADNRDWEVGVACFGSGASLYRAWAQCPSGRTAVGAWEAVGSNIRSWASCGANHFFFNWGVDLA